MLFSCSEDRRDPHCFPTRRSSDLSALRFRKGAGMSAHGFENAVTERVYRWIVDNDLVHTRLLGRIGGRDAERDRDERSEEHTSELQSRENLVCRLLLEKKKQHSAA